MTEEMELEEEEVENTVDPADLDDEALDKMLDESSEEKGDAPPENDDETPEEGDDEAPEDAENKDGAGEGDDKAQETPPEGAGKDESDQNGDNLNRQLQDKESFIQRQSNEIGDLRKALAQEQERRAVTIQTPPAQNPDGTDPQNSGGDADSYFDNPQEAISREVNRILSERDSSRIAGENMARVEAEQSKRFVIEHVPNIDTLFDDMAALAKEDGYSDDNIASFKADPYGSSDSNTLIQYAKRAEMRRELTALKNKGGGKAPADPVLKNAALAAEADSGSLNGKTPPSSREDAKELTASEVTSMSDADLDGFLKRANIQ